MAFKPDAAPGFRPKNKFRRQAAHLAIKKAREAEKRDFRHRRRREEDRDPSIREERQARNVPATIDSKRVWDEDPVGDEEDVLGRMIDVEQFSKRRKLEEGEEEANERGDGEESSPEGLLAMLKDGDQEEQSDEDEEAEEVEEDDTDSMLDSDSDSDLESSSLDSSLASSSGRESSLQRASSPPASTGTNIEMSPEFLKQKFPQIYNPAPNPKILITTSINSALYKEAEVLTSIFPNSTFIRRTAHVHAHKYSVREIAKFASARGYTALIVLMQAEHEKKADGLDIITLPNGPHFHFSVTNWIEGKKLPRHAGDTGHDPELILNNFKTPLGMLTAALFNGLFPAVPQIEGRQVLTLHNQRDYIFLRRHRYVFRDKRDTEKSIVGSTGKPTKGVEDIRVGMQEIGPRMTLKLRRIDRGIQFKSGQEWQWKGGMEKQRTRFNL